MATSSRPIIDGRPYQGYPFVSPAVIDVPTVDAATSKWANLPRKPITTTTTHRIPKSDASSIYVDTPSEAGSSGGAHSGSSSRLQGATQGNEDAPVVYIELPSDEETVSRQQQGSGQENPAYIEETIFFDPFENRQIDLNKRKESTELSIPGGGAGASGSGAHITTSRRPARPAPPVNLNLSSPSGQPSSSSGIPGFMNKESQVYGAWGSAEDGFSLTPLPVSEHPEPPPAYTDIAGPPTTTTSTTTPPRTVVVGPESSATLGMPSSNRKLVECQNCRLRVHTVVVRENGAFTHLIALLTVILCLLPITVVVYCTDVFKYRVHFCPNCNHSVGYEVPVLCQSMVYHGQ